MRFRKRAAIVTGFVTLAAIAAGAAYAVTNPGLSNMQGIIVTTGFNSSTAKAVAAPCFSGRMVTGGGADIDGNTTKPSIRSTWPYSIRHWASEAVEADPTFANWNLDSRALCFLVAADAGYEIVTASSGGTQIQPGVQSATAVCSAGKVVLGSGGRISGSTVNSVLRTTRPAGVDRWQVIGNETDPTDFAWSITAYAVCVNAGSVTTQQVSATSPTTSDTTNTATVSCPSGMHLTGGGADINGGLDSVTLRTTAPASRTQWVVVGQEEDPTAETWNVTAYAVCAVVAP